MFKRTLLNTLLNTLCGSTLAAAVATATAATIGLMAPLSGPQALVGQDQVDGFLLALEQRGGKLGGRPVTVVKEDDQQMAVGVDAWTVYCALSEPSAGLRGQSAVDAVTAANLQKVVAAVRNALGLY